MAAAQAHFRDLAHELGESAMLAMRDGDEMVYLLHEHIAMRPLLGARRHLHSTSLGKAYLAALPTDELDALLERLELPGLTPNTITDTARPRRELDEIRGRGYAVDDVENEPGVLCLGAAVRDHQGRPVCAFSVGAGTVLQLVPFGYSVIRHDRIQPWGQGLALHVYAAALDDLNRDTS